MEIISAASGTSLVASVGSNAGVTLGGLFPIIAGVAGLYLAFVVGKWLISLFRTSGRRG